MRPLALFAVALISLVGCGPKVGSTRIVEAPSPAPIAAAPTLDALKAAVKVGQVYTFKWGATGLPFGAARREAEVIEVTDEGVVMKLTPAAGTASGRYSVKWAFILSRFRGRPDTTVEMMAVDGPLGKLPCFMNKSSTVAHEGKTKINASACWSPRYPLMAVVHVDEFVGLSKNWTELIAVEDPTP